MLKTRPHAKVIVQTGGSAVYRIESQLKQVELKDLRPTQMTVGFKEVEAKRKSWDKLDEDERRQAMAQEFFPAVKGPKKRYFIIDRHHAALALARESAAFVQVGVVKVLSDLSEKSFWIFLDHFSWMHCYDANGERRPLDEIPKRFEDMQDDPYRSLVGELRDAGGFAKVDIPFLEFLWANYLRSRVAKSLLESKPKRALSESMALARSKQCSHLPGWCGKS
jgi:hypothetical protein